MAALRARIGTKLGCAIARVCNDQRDHHPSGAYRAKGRRHRRESFFGSHVRPFDERRVPFDAQPSHVDGGRAWRHFCDPDWIACLAMLPTPLRLPTAPARHPRHPTVQDPRRSDGDWSRFQDFAVWPSPTYGVHHRHLSAARHFPAATACCGDLAGNRRDRIGLTLATNRTLVRTAWTKLPERALRPLVGHLTAPLCCYLGALRRACRTGRCGIRRAQ